jgi:hypothetical protein
MKFGKHTEFDKGFYQKNFMEAEDGKYFDTIGIIAGLKQ